MVFEGVKPALVDSLAQAFGVAPLFAFYEGLWFAGFAPQMAERVAILVREQRASMCVDDSSLAFCSGAQ